MMSEIIRKIVCQKLVKHLQDHKIWSKFPMWLQPLQQSGKLEKDSWAKQYGVQHQWDTIFCSSSQWLMQCIALYTE